MVSPDLKFLPSSSSVTSFYFACSYSLNNVTSSLCTWMIEIHLLWLNSNLLFILQMELVFISIYVVYIYTKKLQSCLTLCDPMDYSPPGSSVHGILQARTLEWVAMPSSRGSSQPRDQNQISCTAGGFFTVWGTREAHSYLLNMLKFYFHTDYSSSTSMNTLGHRLFPLHFLKH